MLLSDLAASAPVLFVGGKGGVGKTSVASAVALARARAGARVLVASTDPAHNLGHLWDIPVGDAATRLATVGGGWVDGLEIDPQRTVEQHLAAVGETLRGLLPQRLHAAAERHLALAAEAPGTHESAVLERIAEIVETGPADGYDAIVFDTAPSGHTVRLMALPEQLTSWTESLLVNRDRSERFGAALRGLGGRDDTDRDAELRRTLLRRRRRFAHLRDVLTDPQRARFMIVLTAERLPVAETIELYDQLRALGMEVAGLVVNRRSPADAGALLAARREQEDRQLAALRERLAGSALVELPLLPGELVGADALAGLADLM